jgi:hypothetical protein
MNYARNNDEFIPDSENIYLINLPFIANGSKVYDVFTP